MDFPIVWFEIVYSINDFGANETDRTIQTFVTLHKRILITSICLRKTRVITVRAIIINL
jgi:hypothetical protein